MGGTRHTAEQIIGKLREAEVALAKGQTTREVAKMPGIDVFFGASSIERLPTERAITEQVKAFKSSSLAAR